jgi:hypothetical protein
MVQKKPRSNSGAYVDVIFREQHFTVATLTGYNLPCQAVTWLHHEAEKMIDMCVPHLYIEIHVQ